MTTYERIKEQLSTLSLDELECLFGEVEDEMQNRDPKTGKSHASLSRKQMRDAVLADAYSDYQDTQRHLEPKFTTVELNNFTFERFVEFIEAHVDDISAYSLPKNRIPVSSILHQQCAIREKEWREALKEGRSPNY